MKVNLVKLENEQNYIIVKAIETGGNRYLYLVNENNTLDVCVRKVVSINGFDHIQKIDSNEELETINAKMREYFAKNNPEN